MSASDKIKDALTASYPGSLAKDWKRRTKTKEGDRTRRDFEHPTLGTARTYEDADGNVSVLHGMPENDQQAMTQLAGMLGISPEMFEQGAQSIANVDQLTKSITETGQSVLRDLAAKVGIDGTEDTGSIFGMRPISEAFAPERIDMLDQAMQLSGLGALPAADRASIEAEGAKQRAREAKAFDPTIKVGDKVQIAKGALVFSGYLGQYGADNVTAAQRQTTVTVATFMDKPKNWLTFLPQEEQDKVEAVMATVPNGFSADVKYLLSWIEDETSPVPSGWRRERVTYSRHAGLAKALMAAQEVYRELFGPDPRFILWGSGATTKAAWIGNATKIADAATVKEAKAAAPKVDKITKRRLMVVGSKWRFTRDCPIVREIDNPEINRLVHHRIAIQRLGEVRHVQHRVGNTIVITGATTGRENTAQEKAQIAALQKQIDGLSRTASTVTTTPVIIPAGTTFEVNGKLSAEYGSYSDKTKGLRVPVHIKKPDYTGQYTLYYGQIEASVEALEVPEEIVYVLRDNATGEFFGGWQTETSNRSGYTSTRQIDVPKMSTTFSGAKKYKTSAAVKASIRDFTGYNSGINDEGEYAPEWASGGSKKIDLPPTWEMVAIDKTTNAEKQVIDVQDWIKGLYRLRDLTQKHCSAVRAAYKKAEEADGGLDTYDAILLFQNRDRGSYKYAHMKQTEHYDNALPFEEDDDDGKAVLAAIKAAGDQMGSKKLRVKTQSAVAYACSLDDGVTAKMMFNHPNVLVRLLDSKTLEDVVGKKEVSA